jgi:glycine cleavage system H protein
MDLSSLRYTESHEWVSLDGETATVGITDFAVSELTDLVFVELPEMDATVTTGESCGVVESVKAASDLISPVSGIVCEVNETLETNLEKLSDSPFEDGWLFRAKLSNPSQLESLMDRAAYEEFCKSESH